MPMSEVAFYFRRVGFNALGAIRVLSLDLNHGSHAGARLIKDRYIMAFSSISWPTASSSA